MLKYNIIIALLSIDEYLKILMKYKYEMKNLICDYDFYGALNNC